MEINSLNNNFQNIEKGFNFAECVPILGIASSIIRSKLGFLQMISGLAISIIMGFAALASKLVAKRTTELQYKKVMLMGLDHAVHGALNILRGYGVAFFGVGTFGLGNALMIIPNAIKEDKFAPFIGYGVVFKGYSHSVPRVIKIKES